ncbi:PDR/VanB family oxidoreductase [Leucobacter chromiireducens]|uniref:PDR/VanB family oxidoreductase n=1 Tax=Leucobacter chromiireducens TaxID=283877 RepID=UPI000F64115C|nr:PDR/VanB family oxidoreductase [Leucobacter chromiireducens]
MVDKQLDWQTARVVACGEVATGILRIELALERPAPARPGTHIDVEVQLPDGRTDVRSYSIVGASERGDRIAISVFRAPTSRGGSRYMHGLRPGDEIAATAPVQDFPLRIGAPAYVLVAGGIGITAIRGMASLLRRLGADYEIHYVGASAERMAYLKEMREAHGARLIEHITDVHGRMSVEALVAQVPATAELYMCGPIRLMEAIRRAWVSGERDITALRYETFGNSGWHEAEPFEVAVPQYDVTVEVQPNESMLEALERAGVDMMFDCRRGECGLCEVRILDLDGRVDHRDVFYSERQKAPNSKMCGCVSRVIAGEPGASSAETETLAAGYRPTGKRARVVVSVS